MKTQFLIAAPTSGAGKTTVARGLMALFTEQGYKVQPFKCGPDYIDTKFHEAVCGRPSVNLDTFMASEDHVRVLYNRYSEGADICIVEGMMGLFDGYDRDRGSAAEIARVLDLPVILVVNARSAAYSMAPLLQGFMNFRQDVRIAGVIFNQVGSERHMAMLRQVCEDVGIECFGYLPKSQELEQGERYLGLDFSQTPKNDMLIKLLEEHVEWKKLLFSRKEEGGRRNEVRLEGSRTILPPPSSFLLPRKKVLVARNAESFSFIYQETLDSFEHVIFFDPEKDVPSFEGVDLLYLPGGYPEKHLENLVANEACRQAIRDYVEQGGQVIAECGGMMYLCKEIVTDDGTYPMCGALPYSITARRADRRLSLGYRRFVLDGREYRGHEFHYTRFVGDVPPSACQVYNAKGEPVDTPVFRYKNVLASYTHLYFEVL